jgi:hypothetical protein
MYWSVEAGFLHSGMRYMTKDIKQLLKEAKLPERTVVLCLNQDLNSALEAKERELGVALSGPNMASLNGAAFPELRAEIASLKDQMIDSQVEFRFRALGRNAYAAIIKNNPPTEGDKVDEQNGFAWDEVTELLVRQCLIEPELDEDDWKTLLGDDKDPNSPGILSSAQYDLLATIAWKVNRRDVDVPFWPSNSSDSLISVDQ